MTSGYAGPDGWSGPLQFLGKGPDGYDNGDRFDCTGSGSRSRSVLCVREGARGGTGTADKPFGTIGEALEASEPGDLIQVAEGEYRENVAVGEFGAPVETELTILGGFSDDFEDRDASRFRSVIDGGSEGPAVQLHLQSDGETVLDGFRLTGGRGLGETWEDGLGMGGGVFVNLIGDGEVLISHNEIMFNETAGFADENRGGGISTDAQDWDGSEPTIRIEDNVIHSNQAGRGAAINVMGRYAAIRRNVVEANVAHSDHGGGIYISVANADVEDNVVRGNEIGATIGYGWGGGIIIAAASAELRGNVITGNYAPTGGSGVFWDEGAEGTEREDLIFANACAAEERSGSAVYVDGGAAPSVVTLEHVTIAGHDCPAGGTGGAAILVENLSKVSVRHSILWGNSRDFETLMDASYTIENSITTEDGDDNRSDDPQFVNVAESDYHLRDGSPARGKAPKGKHLGAYPD